MSRWGIVNFVIVLVLLMVFLSPVCSFSASRRSMLALKDFRTSMGLSYLYSGQESSHSGGRSRTARSQSMKETLSLDLGYSIYKPKYWSGKIDTDFGFEQDWFSGSNQKDSNTRTSILEYQADGTLLKDSYSPLRVYAASSTQQISRRFAKNYTRDYDSYGASLQVHNKIVPANLSVDHSESRTSGLSLQRRQETDRLSLSASNAIKNISQTVFYFSTLNNQNSLVGSLSSFETEIKDYSVTNHLYPLTNRRTLHLKSYYRLRDETGSQEGRDYSWQEDLVWTPGSALTGKLLYEQDLQRSIDREILTRRVNARLEHQLFLSLDTDIEARGRRKEFSSGQEDDVVGSLALVYTKRLTSDSRLTLRLVESYGVIERDLSTNALFIIDERLIIDPVFPNLLANQEVSDGSIVVRDALRTLIYVEGIDYLVFTVGTSSELVIPPGSAISSGDELSVDYEYLVNPSVEYATQTTSLYSSITFLENRLTLYGRYSETSHDLLSGSDDLLRLVDSGVYALGVNGSFAPVSFGANYVDSDIPPDSNMSIDGYLTFAKNWDKRLFSFTIRDVYRKYRDKLKGHNNAFSARADYHRRYKGNLTMKTAAAYRNSSGQNLSREDIALMFDLSVRFGRSLFTLEIDEEWLFYEETKQRDDRVELRLQRYF